MNYLPALNVFNHAILGVNVGEDTLYLDCTAENFPMETLPSMDKNAPALAINNDSKKLFRLPAETADDVTTVRTTTAKLDPNGNFHIHKTMSKTGLAAASFRSSFRNLSKNKIDKQLKESLEDSYGSVDLKSFNIVDIDSIKTDIQYDYEFITKNYLVTSGTFSILKLPFTNTIKPHSFVSYEERSLPISWWHLIGNYNEIIEIELPKGLKVVELPKDISINSKFGNYNLKFSRKGDKVISERKLTVLEDWVETIDYQELKDFYNKLVKADATQLILKQ